MIYSLKGLKYTYMNNTYMHEVRYDPSPAFYLIQALKKTSCTERFTLVPFVKRSSDTRFLREVRVLNWKYIYDCKSQFYSQEALRKYNTEVFLSWSRSNIVQLV